MNDGTKRALHQRVYRLKNQAKSRSPSVSSTESRAHSPQQRKPKPSAFAVHKLDVYGPLRDLSMSSEFKGDLVCKFYFHRRKLVWEQLWKGLKRKSEISFDDIEEITLIPDSAKPSKFGKFKVEIKDKIVENRCWIEINPMPKTNTQWTPCNDFTPGTISGKHSLMFECRKPFIRRYVSKAIRQLHTPAIDLSEGYDSALDKYLSFSETDSVHSSDSGSQFLFSTEFTQLSLGGVPFDSSLSFEGLDSTNSSIHSVNDELLDSDQYLDQLVSDFSVTKDSERL